MSTTTFVTFRQFATENGTTGLQDLAKPLYSKTHKETGEVESVRGIKAVGSNTCYLAVSKSLAGKSINELAKSASTLQVCQQNYVDANGTQRTGYLLCTDAREGVGEVATLVW